MEQTHERHVSELQHTHEHRLNELQSRYELRLGDLLLNRLRLRAPLLVGHLLWVALRNRLVVLRLAAESHLVAGRGERHRAVTTVCSDFPIYSQTFVYQELSQLAGNGFDGYE